MRSSVVRWHHQPLTYRSYVAKYSVFCILQRNIFINNLAWRNMPVLLYFAKIQAFCFHTLWEESQIHHFEYDNLQDSQKYNKIYLSHTKYYIFCNFRITKWILIISINDYLISIKMKMVYNKIFSLFIFVCL